GLGIGTKRNAHTVTPYLQTNLFQLNMKITFYIAVIATRVNIYKSHFENTEKPTANRVVEPEIRTDVLLSSAPIQK
ncbi:MAG: hypothetical protein ACRD8Z_01495, partial [Nitrososphaeraceae archaeon]